MSKLEQEIHGLVKLFQSMTWEDSKATGRYKSSSRNWLQIDWSFPFRLDYPAVPCCSLQKPAGQYWLLSGIFWPFVYLWEVIVWIQDRATEDTLKAREAYEYGRSQTKYCSCSATQPFILSHPFSFQGKFLKSCCLVTCQGGDIYTDSDSLYNGDTNSHFARLYGRLNKIMCKSYKYNMWHIVGAQKTVSII